MKKRISIILVITMLLSMLNYVTVSALGLYPLEEIGECSILPSDSMKLTLELELNDEKYNINYHYTDDEVEYILNFFTDENLVNTGEVFDEWQGSSTSEFARSSVGCVYYELDTYETCLVYFNENNVFFIKRGMGTDENGKYGSYAKQALFTYKNKSIYQEFEKFLIKEAEEYVEQKSVEEEEERIKREEAMKQQQQGTPIDPNTVYIEDFKIIYHAKFDATDFEFFDITKYNGTWGLCSFKKLGEDKETILPFTWEETINGADYYFLNDTTPSNNEVSLTPKYFLYIDNVNKVASYKTNVEAQECDLKINVTDDLKVSDIYYETYENNVHWQTGKIDMSTYTETGTLPAEYFSPDNNIKEEEEKEPEQEKEPEKEENQEELSQEELLKLIPAHIEKAFTEKCPEDEDPDNIRYNVSMYVVTEEIQFNPDLKDNSPKDILLERWTAVYNMAASDCQVVDEKEYYNKVNKNKSSIKKYAYIKVKGAVQSDFELTLYDEYIKLSLGQFNNKDNEYIYLKIKNPDEIIDYLLDIDAYGYDTLETEVVLDNLDLKNKTLDSEPLKVVETVSFKVNVDDTAYRSIYKALANKGEKIDCILTHIMVYENDYEKSYFILELKGSKGTKSYFTSYASVLEYGKCEIFFSQKHVYEDNQLKTINGYYENSPWLLEFYGVPENGEVKSVVLRYEFKDSLGNINGNKTVYYGNTVCDDYDYKFLLDDYEWEKNRNICYMIIYDEDEEWMDKTEAYHKRKALGIKENTFKVNALAQTMLKIDEDKAPEWYKELGRNVSLMILSVTSESRFGRTTAPVLRFRGAAGEIWFDCSDAKHIDFPKEEFEFIWKSTVAFDSTKHDEDHTVEEKLSGKVFCSGGKDSVFESIELYIGDETYKFAVNELNIIGCDVFTRDMVYRSIQYYKKAYWDELDDYMNSMKYGNVYHY